jgi:hypothetical protein
VFFRSFCRTKDRAGKKRRFQIHSNSKKASDKKEKIFIQTIEFYISIQIVVNCISYSTY